MHENSCHRPAGNVLTATSITDWEMWRKLLPCIFHRFFSGLLGLVSDRGLIDWHRHPHNMWKIDKTHFERNISWIPSVSPPVTPCLPKDFLRYFCPHFRTFVLNKHYQPINKVISRTAACRIACLCNISSWKTWPTFVLYCPSVRAGPSCDGLHLTSWITLTHISL